MSDASTIATYDRIAREFAERNWNRDLDDVRSAFARAVAGDAPAERFRILDAGCGPGRDSRWFAARGFQVTGVDLSAGMLAEARRRVPDVEFVRADLCELGFPDGSFDGIWCWAALLHIARADVARVLESFHRILGHGWLWLTVRAGEGEETTQESYGFQLGRRFTYFAADELQSLLELAGFTVHDLQQTILAGANARPWLNVLAQAQS